MSGRRRISAAATLTVVVVTACGSTPPDTASSTSAASPAPLETATTIASTTTTTSTSTTTTTSSSTTTSTTTSTSTTSSTVACRALDIVVLGNSTDYWPNFVVGADAPTDDAWPALLEARLRTELPDTPVAVENGSVLGAGFDIGLYGVTSMRERLQTLAASSGARTSVLLVAPSVVDLQLRSLDVDASFTAFEELLGDARSAFGAVRVLPMNPVVAGFDPDVAEAVVAFNIRLRGDGLITPGEESPLLSDDGVYGRPEFYDDFDDGRLDTPGADPDGLHPDVDGHRRLAEAVAATVVAELASVCR